MTIRPAQAGDYSQIYSLVQTAFATAKVSDGTEQDFVLELRRRGQLPSRAGAGGRGERTAHRPHPPHSFAGPRRSRGAAGADGGPSVVSGWRTGAGAWAASFSKRGGRRAAELGYNALFLVGDPDYYGRYGFQNAVSLGFQNASGVPDQFLLARGADPGCFTKRGGRAGAPLKPRRKSASVEEGLP